MKTLIFIAVIISCLAFVCSEVQAARAEAPTPALTQYTDQLNCTTANMLKDDVDLSAAKGRIKEAVQSCVPGDFKAEMAGLSPSFTPASRADRVESLTKSAELRLSLCEQSTLQSSACREMFSRQK